MRNRHKLQLRPATTAAVAHGTGAWPHVGGTTRGGNMIVSKEGRVALPGCNVL